MTPKILHKNLIMNSSDKINSIPFFFVIGRARSGTTLLRCIFDAHPQINFPLECSFIIHLYGKYGKLNFWDEEKIKSFYHDVISYPKFNFWIIDKNRLLEMLMSMKGKNTYSVMCKAVYMNFNSFYQKNDIRLLGDKNPSYSLYTKKLMKLFPEARFIHIIRDYRSNIISMIRAGFEAAIYSSLAYRWMFVNKQVEKQKKHFPQKFYTLRYEDFVSDPEISLKKMCDFLGIGFSNEMLNYRAKLEEMLAIYPKELIYLHHKSLLNPINADNIDSWKNILTPHQIKIADNVSGKFAEKYGYERMYKKSNFFFQLYCLPGMFYGRLLYFFMGLIHGLPLKFQMKIMELLAKIFKHDWKIFKNNEDVQE